MKELLVHPSTLRKLNQLVVATPHAILLSGKTSSGKTTIAQQISADLLNIPADKLASYPYYTVVNPEASVITIDEVRELQQFLKLRVPRATSQSTKRVITIVQAERMRTEAQNALLKTLEEPPEGTVIILTSDNPERLLSTITSRTQEVSIMPVGEQQARTFFASTAPVTFKRSYALSGGQAGLLNALIHDQEHPLIDDVALAKDILSKKPAERLREVDTLAKDKPAVLRLLDALLRLTHAGLVAASAKNTGSAVRAWHEKQQAVLTALELLQKNANTKLVLDNLFLNI